MIKTVIWKISNLHCASCIKDIQNNLEKIPGVLIVQVAFISSNIFIKYDDSKTNQAILIHALKKIGYPLASSHLTTMQVIKNLSFKLLIAVSFIVLLLSGYMDSWPQLLKNTTLIFGNVVIMFWAGRYIYVRAYQAILRKALNIYSLVSISTISAWLYSTVAVIIPDWLINIPNTGLFWDLPAFVIAIILFGEIIEKTTIARIQNSMEKLLDNKIEQTRVMQEDQEIMTDTEMVRVDDIILIKPYEKIPLDGIVQNGNSTVNEANLTGESQSVHKVKGSKVYSGSINQNGILYVLVTTTSEQSSMAQIAKIMREAKLTKLPIQNYVDYVASVFVPLVMALAVLSGIYWLIVANDLAGMVFAFNTFLCTLLIACPCALGLATPLTISITLDRTLKKGVLIKNAEAIQKIQKVQAVAFDKTGTLTTGKLKISEFMVSHKSKVSREKLLALLGMACQYSNHPLSQTIYEHAKDSIDTKHTMSDFRSEIGLGLSCAVDKHQLHIGNEAWLRKNNIKIDSNLQADNAESAEAITDLLVAVNQQHVGRVLFKDQIRDEAALTVNYLKKSNIVVWIISGDNEENTQKLAEKLGITNYVANASSANKITHIKNIQSKTKGFVCMIGDGINDIGALSTADVAIGINNNINLAMEASDVLLINKNLNTIPYLINLSHVSMKNITQNLTGAFIYNILCIPIAMGIFYTSFGILLTPIWATVAMISSSLTVTFNSLRMFFR